MINLGRGMNVGGWLSQGKLTEEWRKTFVTKADIERIAGWGFDNIRFPFDLPLLCPTPEAREPCEAGMAWLDRGLEWMTQAGLKVSMDMHSLPGYTFMDLTHKPDEVPLLFRCESCQAHFVELWVALAKRYLGRFPNVAFELANEIAAPTGQQWNELAAKAIAGIRSVDKDRVIVVGSNCWNVCFTFTELAVVDDPNIIYHFHFYNPFTFTHQRVEWSPELLYYGKEVRYPGRSPDLRAAAKRAQDEGQRQGLVDALLSYADFFEDRVSDKQHLRELMKDSFDFAAKHKVPLYCGEFGTMHYVPQPDGLKWVKDTIEIFAEKNVAWSYWSYKGCHSGIVDMDGNINTPGLLETLQGK